MAKHYLIQASQVTSSMRLLTSHEQTLTYLVVEDANVTAFDALIDVVDEEEWLKSSSVSLQEGGIGTGILLPKSAGK
jgi:hypothetical protein